MLMLEHQSHLTTACNLCLTMSCRTVHSLGSDSSCSLARRGGLAGALRCLRRSSGFCGTRRLLYCVLGPWRLHCDVGPNFSQVRTKMVWSMLCDGCGRALVRLVRLSDISIDFRFQELSLITLLSMYVMQKRIPCTFFRLSTRLDGRARVRETARQRHVPVRAQRQPGNPPRGGSGRLGIATLRLLMLSALATLLALSELIMTVSL